jgi:predicted DNA-binding transcriptional regulator YafY
MLEQLNQTQRERLAYIEFRLYFLGKVGRADIIERFGVAPAGATRDFAQYRELAPGNVELDNASKMYVIRDGFSPVFKHVPERVMTALSHGFGDGVNPVIGSLVSCEAPMVFSRPKIDILAPITRAINLNKAVKIRYFSSSGPSEREIVPFALVCDGLRWHVRAFDRKREKFSDFVITRMDEVAIVESSVLEKHELPSSDIQWNRIVELDLVPHPARKNPELVKRDYEMEGNVLHVKLRAAMVGYVMQQYHVDCSPDHSVADEAFRLWLSDSLALYGVESAMFAPGYRLPNAK